MFDICLTGWTKEGGIIINHIEMISPDKPLADSPASSDLKSSNDALGPNIPTPTQKRVLEQEEFDRRLKAKRFTFGKRRSLSLASFRLSTPKKVRLPKTFSITHEKLGSKFSLGNSGSIKAEKRVKPTKEDKDRQYLEKYKARGELEVLNLDSLIL